MRTCIDRKTLRCISAETCNHHSLEGLICNQCHEPVYLRSAVTGTNTDGIESPSFQHLHPNLQCPYEIRISSNSVAVCSPTTPSKKSNDAWIQIWKKKFPSSSKIQFRDTKSTTLQENTTEHTTIIFDATQVEIYKYCAFSHQKRQLFFCVDEFGENTDSARTFFHCSDHIVRQSCHTTPVTIHCGGRDMVVRFLTETVAHSDNLFETNHIEKVQTQCQMVVNFQHPIQVLSQQGRLFVDSVHRNAFETFPSEKITVYNAIPGAGKTTSLKAAVRAWKGKKVLVIVFNKSNQDALQNELKGRTGCVVKTLDALCASSIPRKSDNNHCSADEGHESDTDTNAQTKIPKDQNPESTKKVTDSASDEQLSDESEEDCANDSEYSEPDEDNDVFDPIFSDTSFVKSHFPSWDHREKLYHAGGVGSASMIQHRLTHPRSTPTICKFHQRLSMEKLSSTSKPWQGDVNSFPIKKIIDSKSTFAARRYICDRDLKLVHTFSTFDLIICDEYQDILGSEQELRLLRQAKCPIVFIGDYNQTINNFRHVVSDTHCAKHLKCSFPVETSSHDKMEHIEWYCTFRLDPLTTAFLEDVTGVRMHSMRTAPGQIVWNTIPSAPDTLIMCRTNENVIKMAIKFQKRGIRVVAGARIAGQLKAASVFSSMRGMGGLAKKLQKDGQLQSVINMLTKQEIDIKTLALGGFLAVSTVHMLKGFEYTNCAVHNDILDHAHEETMSKSRDHSERNILLVSFSRHQQSLTIMVDILPAIPIDTASKNKKQKTIDFAKCVALED